MFASRSYEGVIPGNRTGRLSRYDRARDQRHARATHKHPGRRPPSRITTASGWTNCTTPEGNDAGTRLPENDERRRSVASHPPFHTGHLGCRPNTEVTLQLLKAPRNSTAFCELIVSSFPRSANGTAILTAVMRDSRGVVQRLVSALAELGINIYAEESASIAHLDRHSVSLTLNLDALGRPRRATIVCCRASTGSTRRTYLSTIRAAGSSSRQSCASASMS